MSAFPPAMVFDMRFSSGVISVESTAASEGKRARRASRLYGLLLKLGMKEVVSPRIYSEIEGRIRDTYKTRMNF